MKNAFLNKLMGATLLMALAPLSSASAAQEINSTLYLESNKSVQLYLPAVLKDGGRALAPRLEVPEESILAIDVTVINQALTASQDSPERVNFPFVKSADDTKIQRNNKGWVCGLRIVDVNDEELRETEIVDRADFCLSLTDIASVQSMATTGKAVRQSFDSYTQAGDLSLMNALSEQLIRDAKYRQEHGSLEQIADGPTMISPLRNCGVGCLTVMSEYGMRNHPVLRKKRLHKGIDLRASIGSQVVSVLPGTILANRTEKSVRKNKKGKKTTTFKGYGQYVIVVHAEANLETLYAHLSDFKKEAGDEVAQGDLIALSGNTGIGTGPHLHFETHVPGKKGFVPQNPRTLMGSMLSGLAAVFEFFNLNA